MGKRKLDLGGLSKSEQSRILEVIQRDFALRKNENNRIEKLNNVIAIQTKEDDPTKCVVCEAAFVWLFNPKVQCMSCELFFCKSKPTCGVEITSSSSWICELCNEKREVNQMSLDWFYIQLKSKFRRHGGAKVLREFYKNKRSGSPPPKPPRLSTSSSTEKSAFNEAISNKSNEDVKQDDETNLNNTETNLTTQIEKAIAAVLLPKLEELKAVQEQSRDPNKALRQIEEFMDKFLQKNATNGTDFNSTVSSFRDAETMTEASDSEFESSPSCSGSMRSRLSQRAPLSERMRNLSPESLRGVLNSQQLPGRDQRIVQGVVRKDEMLATAEVNAALSELLETEHEDADHDQEFSTEIKFTAVGVSTYEATASRRSSNSDIDEESHEPSENWIIERTRQKSLTFTKSPYLPPEDSPTAYYHVTGGESDGDVSGDVTETAVQPIHVKRDFSEISAQSIASDVYEVGEPEQPLIRRGISLNSDGIAESMSKQLNETDPQPNKSPLQSSSQSPVEEEPVIPVKRKVTSQYRKALNVSAAISELQRNKRTSQDSAYHSDVTKSRDSDTSSQDGSIARVSKRWIGSNNKVGRLEEQEVGQAVKRMDTEESFIDEKFLEAFERGKETIIGKQTSSDDSDDNMKIVQVKVKKNGNTNDSYILNKIEFEVVEVNRHKNEDIPSTPVQANGSENIKSSPQKLNEEEHLQSEVHLSKHDDVTDTSSSSSSSDSSDDEGETEFKTQEETLEEIQTYHSFENEVESSLLTSPENSMERRSIDEIVRDLQSAGLEVTKAKFNRTSLNSSLQQPQVETKSKPTKHHTITAEPTSAQDVNWNLYGFTVDPAHYKKSPKAVRQVSLSSLVLSDNESVHSSDTMSPQLRVASPISPDVVPPLPTVAQRRSYFTSPSDNPRSSDDGQTTSLSSMKFDSDSDVSSSVVDKLGYEADTSSAVTSDREVTPPIGGKAVILEESSADELLKTPVNELCSSSCHSSSSSSSDDEVLSTSDHKRQVPRLTNGGSTIGQEVQRENLKSDLPQSLSKVEITKDFHENALPLLTDNREHSRIANHDSYHHDLSSESNDLDQSMTTYMERQESAPVAKPRKNVQKYSSFNSDSDFDERAFVKGFLRKKEVKVSPRNHKIPVVKIIEHDIIPSNQPKVSEKSSSAGCLDEVRSYTSTDIDSSSDSSDDKDSHSGDPHNSTNPTSSKSRNLDLPRGSSQSLSSSSNQSLSNTSLSDFDRSIPFRGSLTMRGSYTSRTLPQKQSKTYKVDDSKKSDRKPFTLQL